MLRHQTSGVAVLSSTESGGCSGSELTEPGSPYSPASSTTSSEECGGARVPPWSREPSSPVAASAPPQPPPSHHSHKRHNLETLIANRLQAKQPVQLTATSTPVKPARSQQVRITEYFNHKMKTHNGLKREIACWNRLEDSKKRCMQKASVTQDLEKYISLLSQTLSPKVLLDVSKMDPPEAAKGMVDTKTCPLPSLLTNGIPNTRIEANKVKGYATKTIDDSTVNGVTCGSNNFVLNNSGNCNSPGSKKVTQRRANPNKRMNRKLPTVGKTTWYKLEDGTNKMQCVKQTPKENATSATISNLPVDKSSVTFSDTAPKITMANSNGLRQIPITFNGGVNNMHQIPMSNAQNCNIINVSQHCNGTVTTSTISPFVAVPQTVMLTALRIPQNSNPQHNLNVAQSNGLNGFTRQNMNITSPSKLNGQFVFPLVQNYNGTVVQIPNLVTKVGHNFVIPHPTQLQSQRQESQQPTQMLINGTLLKMTSSVAPTYSELMTKPTTTSNISFPVMNKSMNTGMPTVMTAKPHYTINMGHPMLMPQPGFFINPVPNNISKDTYGNIETSNNFMQANNSAVSNSYAAVQPSHFVQSVSPCNQVSHTSSIPIPPTKPPDKDTGIMQHPTAMSMEKETTILEQKKVSSFNNNNYPNLTRLLNTNVPLTPHILSRPFAEVCQSTEKLFDITPLEESKSRSFEELQTDSPMDSISPASTPESDETDFTQITVLKDVTSDVRNTILETTFSCVTNESSESGLGTDKSIDSPSDSLTSKECDDDSCLSLSVSVCSVEVQPCQKSPILKQPKTIRFPRQSVEQSTSEQRPKGRRSVPNSVTLCRWETCTEKFESATDLLEHLQMVHVNAQAGRSNYVCEWTGCKVRGKPSCSRLWLERHALSHGGNKPYKCIVDDCERRFSTQILLERHVNNHFNEHSANLSSSKKSAESGPKLIRRNGKVLRYRRQPWSARMFDFFDGGMMEGLAWRLVRATSWRVGAVGRPSGAHTLTLSAALTATRYNHATNTREALVSYNPPHVLDDEWIPEDEVKKTKTVIMSELPVRSKVLLYEQFCSSYRTASTADDIKTCVAPPPPLPSPPPSSATCDSSRVLNNLISKQMEPLNGFRRMNGCAQPIRTPVEELSSWQDRKREEPKMEVSGAAKRKQGRKYGGNAFWPCGR